MTQRLVPSFAAVALMSSAAVGQTAISSANYPVPGHTYQIDFGRVAFKNDYSADGKQMTFTRLTDGRSGRPS